MPILLFNVEQLMQVCRFYCYDDGCTLKIYTCTYTCIVKTQILRNGDDRIMRLESQCFSGKVPKTLVRKLNGTSAI